MSAYYNERDPFAAAWLRELIKAGAIAPGEVDERSIEDVLPADLAGFRQCHFFAGIGVWSYALRLAGVPDDFPIWTGSCPCQPFSQAGKGEGFADERHLWPAWFHLIEQCGPAIVFGEQVADRDGLMWFDLVAADMEGMGYAIGTAPAPSAGFGAPHIRMRNFWVAESDSERRYGLDALLRAAQRGWISRTVPKTAGDGAVGGMAHADGRNPGAEGIQRGGQHGLLAEGGGALRSGDRGAWPDAAGPADRPGPVNSFWRDADWLGCRDGKWRPVEPGTFPLADGSANRVGRLRGYGNAINPRQSAAFVEAAMMVAA